MTKAHPLVIESCGAVTPVGLTSAQSHTAIRAGLSNFRPVIWRLPTEEPGLGAKIPAGAPLRTSAHVWLANLAVRAIRECMSGREPSSSDTALLWCLPESPQRESPSLRAGLEARLHMQFSPHSREFAGGSASLVEALTEARALLSAGVISRAIVGGVDSMIGYAELQRLQARRRIHGGGQPHGLLPAEGACCVSIVNAIDERAALARIVGLGLASEQDTLSGAKLSVGDALRSAFEQASSDAGVPEANIGFVCSNNNGERFAHWETNHARMRFFRTRREELPIWMPAQRAGDLGSASGALALMFATMELATGRAFASRGMIELASEGSLRSACVIEATQSGQSGSLLEPGRRALAQLMS